MAKLLQNAAATRKRARQQAEEDERTALKSSLVGKAKSAAVSADNAAAAAAAAAATALTLPSKKQQKKNKQQQIKAGEDDDSGESKVIYVGHVPHGFYEKEMRKFFGQFGDVRRLKLFRSKKTNRSKGYAFVEFVDSETAQTVAEAMNGYFVHEKQLVVNVIPKEKHHDGMWKRPKHIKRKTDQEATAATDGATAGEDSDSA